MHLISKSSFCSALKITSSVIALSSLFATTNVTANEFDLRLSDDAVHGNFTLDNSRANAKFGLGYFYKDGDDYSSNIVNASLHSKGQTVIGNLPTTVSIGLESNLFKLDNFKGSAIGIGGSVRVNIPNTPGLSIETELHYAPKVLSFGDSNEFRRFRTQANYRIIENADIAIGYRYVNVGSDASNDNETIESGAFLGLQLEL